MRQVTSKLAGLAVVAGCSLLAAALPLGCAPAGGADSAAGLQITVYEARPPAERAADLDANALAAGTTTPAELHQKLAGLGPTRILYHAYQVVGLASDSRITIGSRVPFIASTRVTEAGGRVNAVQYEHLGAIFQFKGEPVAGSGGKVLQAQLNAELSVADQSDVEVVAGVKAQVVRKIQLKHVGEVEVGRPLVLVALDASSGQNGKPVAYICRVVLVGPP